MTDTSSFGAVVRMATVGAACRVALQMPAIARRDPSSAGPMAYGWRGEAVRSHS